MFWLRVGQQTLLQLWWSDKDDVISGRLHLVNPRPLKNQGSRDNCSIKRERCTYFVGNVGQLTPILATQLTWNISSAVFLETPLELESFIQLTEERLNGPLGYRQSLRESWYSFFECHYRKFEILSRPRCSFIWRRLEGELQPEKKPTNQIKFWTIWFGWSPTHSPKIRH